MKDLYKVGMIVKHLKAQTDDEYYLVQVTGNAGKPINLDKDALLLLKKYYEGKYCKGEEKFPMKSAEEIIASRDENNYVEGYITVHISDLIDNNLDSFLDIISEKLVGSVLLMDVTYDVVGFEEDNMIVLKVRGDVSNIISEEDWL